MAYALEAKNICKAFGQAQVLVHTEFSLEKGEIHALVGENGAGKSTLIKILSGAYTKDAGEIWIDGEKVELATPKDAIDHGIRVIHQEINVAPALSIAENIYLGCYPRKAFRQIDWELLQARAKETLARLGYHLDVTQKVGKLSIADQQMVEIAKALSINPKILIMDEPTAALNDQETTQLFEVLYKLRSEGVSIIYITHRFAEIHALADRATVLRDGATISTLPVKEVTDDILVKLMVGKEDSTIFKRTSLEIGEEIFSVKGLTCQDHFNNIDLSVHRGEIVVIFGLVGAGQTDLCRALFGDLPITGGSVVLHGKELHISNVSEACNEGIGYVSDDRKNEGIFAVQSVQENICLAAYQKKLATKRGIILQKNAKEVAQTFFDQLEIRCSGIKQKIGALSGGNQQKGMFCRWLANDTKLLILNMPTRGVDVGARAEIYKTMEKLAVDGCAMLTVSLEVPEVLSIADTVYVMHEGRITRVLHKEELSQEALMRGALGVAEADTKDTEVAK